MIIGMVGQSPWEAVRQDFTDVLEFGRMTHVLVRLLVAALLGGLMGYQRERAGKVAGVRTHMIVAVAAAFFILIPQLEDVPSIDIGRVIQGIIIGVGFLGGGAILKGAGRQHVHGLTTAAGIWMTAAVGIAVGFGRLGSALLAAAIALLIVAVLPRIAGGGEEDDAEKREQASERKDQSG